MRDNTKIEAIKKHILASQNIVICAHESPDGDAIGSCVALASIIDRLNREKGLAIKTIIYNGSPFPNVWNFLDMPCEYTQSLDFPFEPDLVISLDCGDDKRLGEAMQAYIKTKPSINIDHHLGNNNFASLVNFVEPHISATGELVANIAESFGLGFEGVLGDALYIAISSDTGNFSFGNTSASAVQIFSKLVDAGLNVADLRAKIDNTWSLEKFQLWSLLMQNTKFIENGRIAYCLIPARLFTEANAKREDLEGFSEQLRRVAGVRIAMTLREDSKICGEKACSFIKMSLRSHGDDDVRQVAEKFGGGGHKNAAGAGVLDTLDNVHEKIIPFLKEVLD